MEAAVATTTSSLLLLVSGGSRRSPASCLPSPSLLRLRPPSSSRSCCVASTAYCRLAAPRLNSGIGRRCSSSATDGASTAGPSERWILDPAGDGDWRHIGYKVARPGAIEIVSDAMIVGRVADKADIVIPVATVSGTHARLEQKDGSLLVTDLDSTNGTYINERRLNPGFPIPIEPGSFLIFGDIHLAMFRVRKTIVEVPSETEVVSAAVEDASS
ncbi:hypothetical protein U9M48_034730 [Paspalum notatum var. saurae]|uniref:FHA domain-containing protein n=1 Tax=Paspalum notatum var. saurae TaxID=547442 RepID=A0AAQ3X6Z5_PASNO